MLPWKFGIFPHSRTKFWEHLILILHQLLLLSNAPAHRCGLPLSQCKWGVPAFQSVGCVYLLRTFKPAVHKREIQLRIIIACTWPRHLLDKRIPGNHVQCCCSQNAAIPVKCCRAKSQGFKAWSPAQDPSLRRRMSPHEVEEKIAYYLKPHLVSIFQDITGRPKSLKRLAFRMLWEETNGIPGT